MSICFAARERADLQTVHESNSIKFKTTFVCEHTKYLTLTKRENTCVVILPNENKIKMVVVISKFFAKFFSLPQSPKTVQLSMWKNSAKYNALNYYIEYVLAVIFADPQREGYKFHSLLGSIGKLSSEANF